MWCLWNALRSINPSGVVCLLIAPALCSLRQANALDTDDILSHKLRGVVVSAEVPKAYLHEGEPHVAMVSCLATAVSSRAWDGS